MPDRRHLHKNTTAYPLNNNGSFTWNKKTRQIVFMRGGNPKSDRIEVRRPTAFFVEGDDIKWLYQVLHEHFMHPKNMARNWSEDMPEPDHTFQSRMSKD